MGNWTWLTYSGQGHHASLDDAARAQDALLQSLASLYTPPSVNSIATG